MLLRAMSPSFTVIDYLSLLCPFTSPFVTPRLFAHATFAHSLMPDAYVAAASRQLPRHFAHAKR